MTTALNFTLYSGPRRISDWSTWWRNDLRALTELCQKFAGNYSIEIVHTAEDRQRAFHDGVHSTPAILLEMPSGRRQNLGGFSETKNFLETFNSANRLPSEMEAA